MPTVSLWYLSYHLVLQLSVASSIIVSMNYLHSALVNSSLNLSLNELITLSLPTKQGKSMPEIIVISTKAIISSACSLNVIKPFTIKLLNLLKSFDRGPPSTSTYSPVSLNVADSKLRLPGELLNKNPKSTWIMWPLLSSNMLPLCLSLI